MAGFQEKVTQELESRRRGVCALALLPKGLAVAPVREREREKESESEWGGGRGGGE